MSGENTVVEGKTWNESGGEVNNLAKLNLAAKPSVTTNQQSIGDRELTDGSIKSTKLHASVISQINADATIGDGTVTTAKLANSAVTWIKLNDDVTDKMVTRAVVASTSGNYLKYNGTTGETEEVAKLSLPGQIIETLSAGTVNTTSPIVATLSATGNPQSTSSEIEGFMSFYDLDGSGNPVQTIGNVSFTFTKNAAGVWAGTAMRTQCGVQAASAADSGVSVITGTTTLTIPTIGRCSGAIVLTTSSITFTLASTSASIVELGVSGYARLRL